MRRWPRAKARTKARALGPQHHSALIREPDENATIVRGSPQRGVCTQSVPSVGIKSGCASNSFEIPLSLKREQHISRYASARYPICPIPLPPGWAPVVALPTVYSSHVEFSRPLNCWGQAAVNLTFDTTGRHFDVRRRGFEPSAEAGFRCTVLQGSRDST